MSSKFGYKVERVELERELKGELERELKAGTFTGPLKYPTYS